MKKYVKGGGGGDGGVGGDSAGPEADASYPSLPRGASGQQLVAKGVAIRSPWAPKAPMGKFVHFAPQLYR